MANKDVHYKFHVTERTKGLHTLSSHGVLEENSQWLVHSYFTHYQRFKLGLTNNSISNIPGQNLIFFMKQLSDHFYNFKLKIQ